MDPRADGDVGAVRPSLLRPTDVARRTVRRAQLALGALAVVAVVPVGAAVHAAQVEAAEHEVHHLTRVTAVLLEPAVAAPPLGHPAVVDAATPTRARWPVPDGGTRVGLVPARIGLDAGAAVPLVVDHAGDPAPPAPPTSAVTDAVLAALGALLLSWAAVAAAAQLVRRALDSADALEWEREWARVEPLWSGRVG